MKRFLLIFGIFTGLLLFAFNVSIDSESELHTALQETLMSEQDETTDIQQKIEAISNELKSSNCLAPRRVIQTTNPLVNLRLSNSGEKTLQLFRLKQESIFYKLTKSLSIRQTLYISSLQCRMGHHVFALRKLII